MIRAGTTKDIAAVQEIARISWTDTYADILPSDVKNTFLDMSYSNAMLQKRLEKTILLVAEHENEVIGFANFTRVDEDGDAELIAMYLKPNFQRNGYGTQLLFDGLSRLAGGKQLFVYIDAENEKGRHFYEANGFSFLEEFEELFEGYPVFTAQYVYNLEAYHNQKVPAYK